jgi:hypothetical protein
MSAPEVWGPIIWCLFHTLAEHLNDVSIIPQLFYRIQQICMFLPCPECSNDATTLLNQVDIRKITTKQSFVELMVSFHNQVNKKKGKRLVKHSDVQTLYTNMDLSIVFTNFISAYTTIGNIKLMVEEAQRKQIRGSFSTWLYENRKFFVKM